MPVLLVIGLLVLGYSPAVPDEQTVGAAASPLAELPFSHLLPHHGGPPDELLVPLPGGREELLKGFSPADEARLAQSLQHLALQQRLLRVAVGVVEGIKAALIKFQAGDSDNGAFQIRDVQADAVAVLEVAFSSDPSLAHVDIWSVVPGAVSEEGQMHRPVFSVAADREAYARAAARGRTGAQLLGALGVVRYDPLFTRYARDDREAGANPRNMPPSAYVMEPLGSEEPWRKTLQRAAGMAAADWGGTDVVQVVRHGARSRPRVAITIDDGPCPLMTPLILRVLAKEGARASFFVVGEKAEQYPELLREIVRGGHLLGNHTYHHRRLSGLPAEELFAEIEACQAVIGRLTGQAMRYLRPPGGSYSEAALRYLAQRGYTMVLWTHNAGDWGNPPVSAIVRRCLTNIRPGSVILMHGGDINSVRALPRIIRGLRARGLEPVPLPEMLGPGVPSQLTIAQALALPQNGWRPDTVK